MKFRVVLKTQTRKGYDLALKLKVPPSKHQGLINFLNTAIDTNHEVTFTVEKVSSDKEPSESSVFGKFNLQKKSTKKESSSSSKK